jgi:hypothetical protein
VAAIFIGKEGKRRRARERRTATAGQSRVRTKTNTSFFLFVGAFASPHKGLDFKSPLIRTGTLTEPEDGRRKRVGWHTVEKYKRFARDAVCSGIGQKIRR